MQAPHNFCHYVVNPADPRAPSQATWECLSSEERQCVIDALPAEVPYDLLPPEGDEHRDAKSRSIDALDRFFRTTGRSVYVSGDMSVYYPGEPRFAPDIFAVLDGSDRKRRSWIVQQEGIGLDFVLEVHVAGDLAKDIRDNPERCARLGIGEYFVFDKTRQRIHGYRLPPSERGKVREGRVYERILPQMGRWASEVLGIELTIEDGQLRFMVGNAPLEHADEVIRRLATLLDGVIASKEGAAGREEEARAAAERRSGELEAELQGARAARDLAEDARDRAERAREEERRAREQAELRLAELEAEIARLRSK